MRKLIFAAAALLLAGTVASPGPVQAQSHPTADQIISALKPTGPLGTGTRGVRPIMPSAGAAAPAAASSAATAPAGTSTTTMAAAGRPAAGSSPAKPPSINLTVQFELGSAELTADAMRTLDELGRALTNPTLAGYRFRIEGHTDTVGTAEYNKNLSDLRAAAAARYLEGKFGVSASRLETVGMGDTALLVATPPQTPDVRNRRVQVINIGA